MVLDEVAEYPGKQQLQIAPSYRALVARICCFFWKPERGEGNWTGLGARHGRRGSDASKPAAQPAVGLACVVATTARRVCIQLRRVRQDTSQARLSLALCDLIAHLGLAGVAGRSSPHSSLSSAARCDWLQSKAALVPGSCCASRWRGALASGWREQVRRRGLED